MQRTDISLHTEFQVGAVDPRIYGGFLEHLGRAVYGGVYEPGSLHADAEGFRTDVMSALRRLRMTAMRYPGGNFVSGYHWQDGVGPRADRPAALELAWRSIEPNLFGTDEFVSLARKMAWDPMLAVNLGTGTPEEARDWVEYCNSSPGTVYADMRVTNGSTEPHGVKLWCLGNEMDGPWQMGHVPAAEYALRAQQAARLMKGVDPTIEVVACGSCGIGMKTYMDWDREVLEYMGDLADYVSLHRYVGNPKGDTADYLAVTASVDRQIEEMDAACRFVQARNRSRKRTLLCFDEWNVWYRSRGGDGQGKIAPPLLEEVYNLEDALVVAGFLNSFVRHADVVKIANIAQIVNVIAPVLTRGDEMLLQSIFYPFEMMSSRRDGISLQVVVDGPRYDSASYGTVNTIDASAVLGDGVVHVFATNRDLGESAEVSVCLGNGTFERMVSADILSGSEAGSANSFEQPNAVTPTALAGVRVSGGEVTFELPPLSFGAVSLGLG